MSSDEFESLERTVFDMSSCPAQIPVGKRKALASDSEDDLFTEQSKPKKKHKFPTAGAKPHVKSSCSVNPPEKPSSSVKLPPSMAHDKNAAPKCKPRFVSKSKQTEPVPSFASSVASQNNTAKSLGDIGFVPLNNPEPEDALPTSVNPSPLQVIRK